MKAIQRINMINRKPFRTVAQKADARATAVKCEDGAYRSTAPVSNHTRVLTATN